MSRNLSLLLVAVLLIAVVASITWFSKGLDLQTMLMVGIAKGLILVLGIGWIVRQTNRQRD